MVVAYLALFVALGGSADAVKQLPKNSVGPKQLKKNAVTTQKVRKNAIDGRRVNYGVGEPPAEPVAFYKDHEGIVRLRGIAFEGVGGSDIFYLPAGYRPTGGRYREFAVLCSCAGGVGPLFIYGSDDPVAEHTGGVYAPGSSVVLDGVGFRAES